MVALSAGTFHALALQRDGRVWAWGANDYNQLGTGRVCHNEEGANCTDPTPRPVRGLSAVIGIAAGGDHSLALRSDGTVWAWGDNSSGQVGAGPFDSSAPRPVQGLGAVVAIAAGSVWGEYSLALRRDGTVWAWGSNYAGVLGIGVSLRFSTRAIRVQRLSHIRAIAAGTDAALALGTGGTVWAWGGNGDGQLGIGRSGGIISTPERVQGLNDVVAIAAGGAHSLALRAAYP